MLLEFVPTFTAITRVQIPSGTPNRISSIGKSSPDIRGCKKPHFCVPFAPSKSTWLRCPNDGIVVSGVSHREEQRQHCSLRGVLGRSNCLHVDIHRRTQCGMPHQFLHYFEFSSDAPEKRGVRVPEGMPSDALLDSTKLGNRPNILACPQYDSES